MGCLKKKNALAKCKLELDNALRGQYDGDRLFPAFHDTVQKYQIPHSYFMN